jgi:hypothetical protein
MLRPTNPSPCCKDKGRKLTGTNPDTHRRTCYPTRQEGKVYLQSLSK